MATVVVALAIFVTLTNHRRYVKEGIFAATTDATGYKMDIRAIRGNASGGNAITFAKTDVVNQINAKVDPWRK